MYLNGFIWYQSLIIVGKATLFFLIHIIFAGKKQRWQPKSDNDVAYLYINYGIRPGLSPNNYNHALPEKNFSVLLHTAKGKNPTNNHKKQTKTKET